MDTLTVVICLVTLAVIGLSVAVIWADVRPARDEDEATE